MDQSEQAAYAAETAEIAKRKFGGRAGQEVVASFIRERALDLWLTRGDVTVSQMRDLQRQMDVAYANGHDPAATTATTEREEQAMENGRFDALAQQVAAGATRRSAVRALSAVALGALGTRLGLTPAAAKCKQVGKKCKKGDKCCAGAKCKGKRCRCNNDSQCGDGQICLNGNCVADPTPCPGDQPTCGGDCCDPGQLCQNQVCVNGDLEINDDCDPNAPGACQTGVCGCFGQNNVCTCREETCLPPGAGCLQLKNCCDGFCIGNAQVCSQV